MNTFLLPSFDIYLDLFLLFQCQSFKFNFDLFLMFSVSTSVQSIFPGREPGRGAWRRVRKRVRKRTQPLRRLFRQVGLNSDFFFETYLNLSSCWFQCFPFCNCDQNDKIAFSKNNNSLVNVWLPRTFQSFAIFKNFQFEYKFVYLIIYKTILILTRIFYINFCRNIFGLVLIFRNNV